MFLKKYHTRNNCRPRSISLNTNLKHIFSVWYDKSRYYTLSNVSASAIFLLNISIIINAFVCNVHSFTRCFPSMTSSFNNKNRMSTGNLHCKRHEKYTDDNVKMCKETREVLKNKRCQIFSITDLDW